MNVGDEDFKDGCLAGITIGFILGFLLAWLMFLTSSDESDNTTTLEERINTLEERINTLELYHYDISGSLQLIRERVRKPEESEEGK